jgi:hypothetical protein
MTAAMAGPIPVKLINWTLFFSVALQGVGAWSRSRSSVAICVLYERQPRDLPSDLAGKP